MSKISKELIADYQTVVEKKKKEEEIQNLQMKKFSKLDPVLQRKRTTLVGQMNKLRNEVRNSN
jgi:hypothetical protein